MLQKHKYILSKEVSQDVLSQSVKRGLGAQKGCAHVMVSGNETKLKNSKSKFDLGYVKTCICSYSSFLFILMRAVALCSGLLTPSKLRRISF